jgi:putative PIN family toxin of toxin-antitoxin system
MFDTNILITAGIFDSEYYSRITARIAEEHSIVLSSQIIDELWLVEDVKFPEKKHILERFLKRLSYEISYTPTEINPDEYPAIRDQKDSPILASAMIADVDVFVTNDKDFAPIDIERPEIMRLMEFQEKYIDRK